jgi:hypothetical protein
MWPPIVDNPLMENLRARGEIQRCSTIILLAASIMLLRAMFDVGYFPPNTPPVR